MAGEAAGSIGSRSSSSGKCHFCQSIRPRYFMGELELIHPRVPELQLRGITLCPIPHITSRTFRRSWSSATQGPGAPAPGGLPYVLYLTLQAEHFGGAGAPPPQKKAPTPSGAGAAISYTSNSRFTPVGFLPSPARPVAPGGRRPRRRRRQGRSGYPAGSRSAASAWKAAAGRVS